MSYLDAPQERNGRALPASLGRPGARAVQVAVHLDDKALRLRQDVGHTNAPPQGVRQEPAGENVSGPADAALLALGAPPDPEECARPPLGEQGFVAQDGPNFFWGSGQVPGREERVCQRHDGTGQQEY